ncbi:hypothetical protein Unana1_05230 [Umbelopsis nana]
MTEIREFDEIETVEVLQDSLDAEFLPELPEEQDISQPDLNHLKLFLEPWPTSP